MAIGDIVGSIFVEGIERFFKTKAEDYVPLNYRPVTFCCPEGDFEFHFDDGEYRSDLFRFYGRGFTLQNIFSMDGFEDRVVEYRGVLVYHDCEDENGVFRPMLYKEGPWEKELKRLYKDFSKNH